MDRERCAGGRRCRTFASSIYAPPSAEQVVSSGATRCSVHNPKTAHGKPMLFLFIRSAQSA